jgi:hypothetical protein
MMTEPIGSNPLRYQYSYQPQGTSAVNPLTRDINQQQPASVSQDSAINSKPKSGVDLPDEKYRDCKT